MFCLILSVILQVFQGRVVSSAQSEAGTFEVVPFSAVIYSLKIEI